MANHLETGSKVIPDLYYDLIARVVPGGAALAAIVYVSEPSSLLPSVHHEYKIWFLLFGGYFLGLLLTGGSAVLFDFMLARSLSCISDAAATAVGGRKHYGRIDEIAKAGFETGTRLWKMVAERVCLQNALVACLLIWLLPTSGALSQQVKAALPWVAAACAVAWLHRTVLLHYRVETILLQQKGS